MFCFIFLLGHNILGTELIAGLCVFSYGDHSYRCSFVALITAKRQIRSALQTFPLVPFKPVFFTNISITCEFMLVVPDMMTVIIVVLLQDVKIYRGLFELVGPIGY